MKLPTLKTKRLVLRQATMEDAKDLARNLNNLDISRWLLVVPYPYRLKDAKEFIQRQEDKAKKKKRESYQFSIELKEEGRVIGGIGISSINKYQGTASMGYWLGEDYWRKGYVTEAAQRVLRFAFDKLKLRRLEAEVYAGNKKSAGLLKKLGFKLEGVARKAKRSKATGKIIDVEQYGLLRDEWKR